MGLVIVSSRAPRPPLRRTGPLATECNRRRRYLISVHCPRPPGYSICRLNGYTSKCFVANDVHVSSALVEADSCEDLPSNCSTALTPLTSDVFDSSSVKILEEDGYINSLLGVVPVLTKKEQDALAATPAHPTGLYALYASFLVGNFVEQLWAFAWPAAVASLRPSLLPVAVVGFFAKLSIFVGAPLVGDLMDHFPRIPAYHSLNIMQTAAQLLSSAMIIHALNSAPCTSASAVLLQPWFIVLVVAEAIERITGLAIGVTVERDWVVLLAGTNRPIALSRANAMLNRIDLLCEIAGASTFGFLLTKFRIVTCLKVASWLMICALPILLISGQLINGLSSGALESSKISQNSATSLKGYSLLNIGMLVENGLETIRSGWVEYRNQPVLPASLAYVFLYFNIALAPGSIMTAYLMHHGVTPSIIGGFSGLCAFMGVAATFMSTTLVKSLGILKAGAAGLVFQAALLTIALAVLCVGTLSGQRQLLSFLLLIVLSRLGHMSYDVVGTQILQTGIPASKANLIGTTEISIASLAELAMLGVAIVANDIRHFNFLVLLSASSVFGAAYIFCSWLANPSKQQRKLFSLDPQCQTCIPLLICGIGVNGSTENKCSCELSSMKPRHF
ncbi:Solute carrier family 40 member 2, chloroplastic [Apostasia shenzhenica]|uniref:Solute carrier family 40 member n=1 Tax=Apostasia shenzhenica TaxID=1088818 RepID=A0A2I0B5C6_9ASPA|nr:Solute carrier family 40 member 2, chloroplastic [Apostasia shenzhenica]